MKNVKRYDRKEKKLIEDQCPAAIAYSNKHMGGVDLLDAFLSYYQINVRSKKWYHRLLWHLFDLTFIQGWILHKKILEEDSLCLKNFKLSVAGVLLLAGKVQQKKGRPSQIQIDAGFDRKSKRGPAAPIPSKAIRGEKIDHWPGYTQKKLRCKLPGCNAITQVVYTKCNVNLCFTSRSNCFKMFHIN